MKKFTETAVDYKNTSFDPREEVVYYIKMETFENKVDAFFNKETTSTEVKDKNGNIIFYSDILAAKEDLNKLKNKFGKQCKFSIQGYYKANLPKDCVLKGTNMLDESIFIKNNSVMQEEVLNFKNIKLSQTADEQLREQLKRHEVKSIKNYNGTSKKLKEGWWDNDPEEVYNEYDLSDCHLEEMDGVYGDYKIVDDETGDWYYTLSYDYSYDTVELTYSYRGGEYKSFAYFGTYVDSCIGITEDKKGLKFQLDTAAEEGNYSEGTVIICGENLDVVGIEQMEESLENSDVQSMTEKHYLPETDFDFQGLMSDYGFDMYDFGKDYCKYEFKFKNGVKSLTEVIMTISDMMNNQVKFEFAYPNMFDDATYPTHLELFNPEKDTEEDMYKIEERLRDYYKYAGNVSFKMMMIYDEDIFELNSKQGKFDFVDDSYWPIHEANRVYNFRIVLEQPEPERFHMRKDVKFKTKEEADNMATAWNLNMSKRAKDYGCKFVVEEIEDKPRKTSPKTSDNPDFVNPFQVGDILEGDVGYSMSLPQFWEVTKVTPQYVNCTRLETQSVSGDGWRGECVPVEGCYMSRRNYNGKMEHETAKMQVKKFGTTGKPYQDYSAWLNRRYRFTKWDGRPAEYDHFD